MGSSAPLRPLAGYHAAAPRPLTDRQKWEEELAELPATIVQHRAALAALAPGDRKGREFHDWLVRRAEQRMAELRRRLASMALVD